MILFFNLLGEIINQLIHQLWFIRIRIMPRVFQPLDRDSCLPVPCFVITLTGAGPILFSAYQK